MNTINNKNNIRIHLVGLQPRERMVFERVINFNKTHGLQAQICNDIATAHLVISTEFAFSRLRQIKNDQVIWVITKNAALGDIQIAPPLFITHVMKALESAIKLVNKKQEEKHSIQSSVSSSTTHNEKIVFEPSEPEKSMLYALVIDDSSAIRKQLELELRVSKVAADFAESGEQALEKVKQRQFDLIFLDIMMPGIDGYETCKLIRANAEYKKTPIIMLSGKTSPLDEVQGIIAGATTYLTKPVKSADFQKVLTRVTAWLTNFKAEEQKKKQLLKDVT